MSQPARSGSAGNGSRAAMAAARSKRGRCRREADAGADEASRADFARCAAAAERAATGPRIDRLERIARMDWAELRETVATCRACRLCERRKQAVLGRGRHARRLAVCRRGAGRGRRREGRALRRPGRQTARQHAGGDRHLARPERVHRQHRQVPPPGNRTPEAEEMATCLPYLARQIELLQPKLIVALGRPAAQTLTRAAR